MSGFLLVACEGGYLNSVGSSGRDSAQNDAAKTETPRLVGVTVRDARIIDVAFSADPGSAALSAGNYHLSGEGRGTLDERPDEVVVLASLQSGQSVVYRLIWSSGRLKNGGSLSLRFVPPSGGASTTPPEAVVETEVDVSGNAPVVLGLSNGSTATKTKSWSWSCTQTCLYRYVVDESPTWTPEGDFGTDTGTSLDGGDGTFYLHVQAQDDAGNLSEVVTVSAALDNTAPAAATARSWVGGSNNTAGLSTTITASWTPSASSDVVSQTIQFYTGTAGCTSGNELGSPITLSANASTQTLVGTEGPRHLYKITSTDAAGNSASACSGYKLIDVTPPTLTIGAPNVTTLVRGSGTITFPITYANASAVTLADGDVTVTGTNGITCTATVSGSGTTARTVTLGTSACVGAGGSITISLAAGTATDAAGNLSLAAGPSASVNLTVGAPAWAVFLTQPTDVLAGQAFATDLRARITDAYFNTVVTATDTVTLAIGTNPAQGTLSGTLSRNAVNGIATFPGISIDNSSTGSGYQLVLSSGSLVGDYSSVFYVRPSIAFQTQPANVAAGQSFASDISVRVIDFNGNPDTSSTVAITLSIPANANPGSSTLSGTLTRNAVAGVATFPGISLNKVGSGYRLLAGGTLSSTFDVTAGPAHHATISGLTSGFIRNFCSSALSVAVYDAHDNAVTDGTPTVQLSTTNATGVTNFYSDANCGNLLGTSAAPTDFSVAGGAGNVYIRHDTNESVRLVVTYGSQSQNLDVNHVAADTWSGNTPYTGAPSRRHSHSAIWTGTEMWIFGGASNSTYLSDVQAYNPATNTWRQVAASGSGPAARGYHTAVWTGSAMIVIGGRGTGYTQLYDAWSLSSSGTWTSLASNHGCYTTSSGLSSMAAFTSVPGVWNGSSVLLWNTGDLYTFETNGSCSTLDESGTSNAPLADRSFASAVWTGSRMLVWGGQGNGSGLNTGGQRNSSGNWSATSTSGAFTGLQMHSTVWTGTEMIVWGGVGGGWGGKRYNPSTNTWGASLSTTGTPSSFTYRKTAVYTGSAVIFWGGSSSTGTDLGIDAGYVYVP